MANYHEDYTEDQIEKLVEVFCKIVPSLVRKIETSPASNFSMGRPIEDERGSLRSESWEAMKDFQDQIFPIQLPWYDESIIEFDHPSEIGRQIFVNACYDPNEFYVLDQFLGEGMNFIDVGANIGLYSLFAATRVGSSGRVIAFEPSRREASSFERNVSLNGMLNVQLLRLAVGERAGTATLSVADPGFDGHNTLGKLALRRNTNIRYTTDEQEYHWASFSGRKTQLALGKASHIEILLYSDTKLDLLLTDVTFEPRLAPVAPWPLNGGPLTPLSLPHQFADRFAGADVSAFGPVLLKNHDGALLIESGAGAGVALRWELDPSVESLVTIEGSPRAEAPVDTYAVEVIALDDLIVKNPQMRVDVLKIDVEGYELAVLEGARTLIENHRPLLLIEVANDLLEEKQIDPSDIARFLHSMNYILFDVAKGQPRLIDVKGDHGSNVFAVPEKHLDKMLSLGGLKRDDLNAELKSAERAARERQEQDALEASQAAEQSVEEAVRENAVNAANSGASDDSNVSGSASPEELSPDFSSDAEDAGRQTGDTATKSPHTDASPVKYSAPAAQRGPGTKDNTPGQNLAGSGEGAAEKVEKADSGGKSKKNKSVA